MTTRRTLITSGAAAAGLAVLAAPSASATTAATPTLSVYRVCYDYYSGCYYGHGYYGQTQVTVWYQYCYGYRYAYVEPKACTCSGSRVTYHDTGRWTCFNGCWWRIIEVRCEHEDYFEEGGGSGSYEPAVGA